MQETRVQCSHEMGAQKICPMTINQKTLPNFAASRPLKDLSKMVALTERLRFQEPLVTSSISKIPHYPLKTRLLQPFPTLASNLLTVKSSTFYWPAMAFGTSKRANKPSISWRRNSTRVTSAITVRFQIWKTQWDCCLMTAAPETSLQAKDLVATTWPQSL